MCIFVVKAVNFRHFCFKIHILFGQQKQTGKIHHGYQRIKLVGQQRTQTYVSNIPTSNSKVRSYIRLVVMFYVCNKVSYCKSLNFKQVGLNSLNTFSFRNVQKLL